MGIDQLQIKLDEAKQAIAIPDFKRDDLLKIALVAISTLQLPLVLDQERQIIERQHRRLAFLGDRLFDAVLAGYLFDTYPTLTNRELNDWREEIACRESLTHFAINLGLPDFCSSWNIPIRKQPKEEPGVYGEMFEALIGVIYLDGNRSFERVSGWLYDRFLRAIIEF